MSRTSESNTRPARRPAVLIAGPTGAGKTPLGDWADGRQWDGRRCIHFDFGVTLRRVRDCGEHPALSGDDVKTVLRSLEERTLLGEKDFHIAAALLETFCKERCLRQTDLVLLNGLPRHVSQAQGVDRLVDMQRVVLLQCPADVVRRRIAADTGGDRSGRDDDAAHDVALKLRIFEAETLPVLDHYRAKGVSISEVPVHVDSTARDLWDTIMLERE